MNALAKLENATRMLAEVRNASDAKHVMDVAAAAKHYARKHKLGKEAISHAHSIEMEAMRMLGEFQRLTPKATGGEHGGKSRIDGTRLEPSNATPTLADNGLTKKESADSQLLAAVAEEQPEVFEQIKTGEKSITQVKRERTRDRVIQKISEMPSGKFRVLYADPPWKYADSLGGDISDNYGGAEKHYPSMTIAELSAMPVSERCEDNSVLLLWTTSPLLFECAAVFRAWGFQYKSAFIWDKVKHNMGHYNSVRHELLLICTRGSCTPDIPTLYDSVQSIERTTHSQKPEEFRQIIDTLYPYGRRVELFARGVVPDPWVAWGAEAVTA